MVRGFLGIGIFTGKFKGGDVKLPVDDVRHVWNFKEGPIVNFIRKVEDLREVITSYGCIPAQGTLGWLCARSNVTIPIPSTQ